MGKLQHVFYLNVLQAETKFMMEWNILEAHYFKAFIL